MSALESRTAWRHGLRRLRAPIKPSATVPNNKAEIPRSGANTLRTCSSLNALSQTAM